MGHFEGKKKKHAKILFLKKKFNQRSFTVNFFLHLSVLGSMSSAGKSSSTKPHSVAISTAYATNGLLSVTLFSGNDNLFKLGCRMSVTIIWMTVRWLCWDFLRAMTSSDGHDFVSPQSKNFRLIMSGFSVWLMGRDDSLDLESVGGIRYGWPGGDVDFVETLRFAVDQGNDAAPVIQQVHVTVKEIKSLTQKIWKITNSFTHFCIGFNETYSSFFHLNSLFWPAIHFSILI